MYTHTDSAAEMENILNTMFLYLLYCVLFLLYSSPSSSHPLCTDLRAPMTTNVTLAFCPYIGKTCCDSSQDLQLQARFHDMNISDSACAAAVKSVLCATCDPFSADLFSTSNSIPILCNSTNGISFCSTVWESCRDIPIPNSPFAPSLQSKAQVSKNSTLTRLTQLWPSKPEFCAALGGPPVCFDGRPVSLNKSDTSPPPNGICLERISNGSYTTMAAHPDGSGRAFFSDQAGRVWLATIPEQDSGEALGIDESDPFLDLTDEVHVDTVFGLMGIAFHPDFGNNGRIFASFNSDKERESSFGGTCGCNSEVRCDPSDIGSSDGGEACRYQTVIGEFSANGTGSSPSKAESAKPQEVRRIFTMGLPYNGNHGGQILFGPDDGYLYFMMGDGGGKCDPYNFAQNKKSLLGKIMRIDVDNIPSQEELVNDGRWGNYSVPQDNPFRQENDTQPEIWALGFRNPWRCSFDSERPSYFFCADVGQDTYEEVDLVSKGGNYGWRVYEGTGVFLPQRTPGGNTSADSIDPIFPILGYTHSGINNLGSAAIMGGYVYRSKTDPCTYGSYLYADLYASHIWAASESPANSGNFTAKDVPFSCAEDSPIRCESSPGSELPSLKYIVSFGEDNRKDVYVLTQSGVYRVVRPSRCNYTCSKEAKESTIPPTDSPSHGQSSVRPRVVFFLFTVLTFLELLL